MVQKTEIEIPEALQELLNPYRYKIIYGGRGGAKSATFARLLLIRAMEQKTRIVCAREIQLSINDSVKRLLDDVVSCYKLDNFFRSIKTEITGANGSNFLFVGLRHNIDKIKSLEGADICWVEEADSVSKESWNVLIPTIRKKGSEIWASYNPRDVNAPVHQMFVVNRRSNSLVRKVNYDSNPWFPEVLRVEMEYDRSHDFGKYSHVWLGEPVKYTDALVFKNWRIDTFEAPEDAVFYYGADWGFSQDPTTLIRLYLDLESRTIYIDYEAYGVGVEIDKTPELFDTVPESRKWVITADSARPETISYMRRQGFNIQAAKKGAGSVEDGIEFLKSFSIVVHSRCRNMIYELGNYCYKTDQLTGNILPRLEDKDNHCLDSARYSIEKVIRKKVPYISAVSSETGRNVSMEKPKLRPGQEAIEIWEGDNIVGYEIIG